METELDRLAEELTLRCEVDSDGTTRYRNRDNRLHRVYGPAVIWPDGTEFWHQNGKRHRINGPAVIWGSGERSWYQNDNLHRLDGPALIWANGIKYWYINGVSYTEERFNAHPLVVAHRAKSAL